MEFLTGRKTWCAFVRARYYSKGMPIRYYAAPAIWKGLKMGISQIVDDTVWVVGRNSQLSFWFDKWVGGESLQQLV